MSESNEAITVIGWREWVSLPELGLRRIKAKVDTGARTSALHAFKLEPFDRAGVPWVRFRIHPRQRRTTSELSCEAAVKDQRIVRDSGGHEEERFVIETSIQLGTSSPFVIEVTLTPRDNMAFRMLLGRTALRGRHIVDVSRSFVVSRRKAGT